MSKPELRRRYCALRECLPAEGIAAASAAICHRLSCFLPPASSVLTYLAFRNEPDLSLLFDLLPHVRWTVPRIQGRDLVIHPYDPARLVRHRFGMLEPAADLPVANAATLDVVLAPGVAFDRCGGRLGLGGGYYDRFLPTTPALRVGVAYAECLTDTLPCNESDQRMDWIATPDELFATGAPRRG
jgi:5-formyltetrahydrofolate cyclo-ligase